MTVKLAPPNYLYLKFRYLPQNFKKKIKLKRQAYGFTKPLVVCQNFAGWSVLAQLVFAGLQYPLSEPIPCVPCLLSDLNPSCNPPNHFFANKFLHVLNFLFPSVPAKNVNLSTERQRRVKGLPVIREAGNQWGMIERRRGGQ